MRILIVEDEIVYATALKKSLERLGHETPQITGRGEEALRLAAEDRPDLVLMDIRLSGPLDGIEVAMSMRNQYHLPVIFLTAYSDEDTLQRAAAARPYGYLLKPFQMHELQTSINLAAYIHAIERNLERSESRYQTLSQRLLNIQEDERRYLAGELHDEIGQALTAARLSLETAYTLSQEQESATSPNLSHQLQKSLEIIELALHQVRNLSLGLRPAMLDDLGLGPALRWLVERHTQLSSLPIELMIDLPPGRLQNQIELVCYRIAQEALSNILRHANASEIKIELWLQPARRGQTGPLGANSAALQELHLLIRDNGRGFDPGLALQNAAAGKSLGLLGMQERANLLNGDLDIQSAPDEGCEIHVRLPLPIETPAGEKRI